MTLKTNLDVDIIYFGYLTTTFVYRFYLFIHLKLWLILKLNSICHLLVGTYLEPRFWKFHSSQLLKSFFIEPNQNFFTYSRTFSKIFDKNRILLNVFSVFLQSTFKNVVDVFRQNILHYCCYCRKIHFHSL